MSRQPTALTLDILTIVQVRNIDEASIELAPRFNIIAGNNGQGKTTILEAIYLLATSKSFRTTRLAELVAHANDGASVQGSFVEHWPDQSVTRSQTFSIVGSKRRCRINGNSPDSPSHYATRSPVVVFEPQQMVLSTGPASARRKLLDRVTIFTHPATASQRIHYARALRERQRLLSQLWPHFSDNAELDAYEAILAEHGSALTKARQETAEALWPRFYDAFTKIAAPDLDICATYDCGGDQDLEVATRQLHDNRQKDAQQKRTAFGPHLDDLRILLAGHPARKTASQGQHRSITLALKLAELSSITEARGLHPLLLLDDVSSELDAERTAALLEYLATTSSQLFLTTTRPELIPTGTADRRDFSVDHGVIHPV